MNLHILPDSRFSQVFYQNIQSLDLLPKNKFIVRSNAGKLKHVVADIPFAKASTSRFENLVGDTFQYDKVFIHNFSPVLYPWVAKHAFRELNWMVWGADLYNLSFIKQSFLEAETQDLSRSKFNFSDWLYELKITLVASRFKDRAYAKVNKVFTWMKGEYQFATESIPSLRASHEFFFYENQQSYEELQTNSQVSGTSNLPTYILGNSGYAINNHVDALESIRQSGKHIHLMIPVSYGDPHYISLLRKICAERRYSNIEFVDAYMSGSDYIGFLAQADGLVINTIRPQGYGNIFMMIALGKPVFMNEKNISLPDLKEMGIKPLSIEQVGEVVSVEMLQKQAAVIKNHFSRKRLKERYAEIFS